MNTALSNLRRVAGVLVTLLLMGVHAGLLWQRVADNSMTEPRVVARWLGAALLLLGLTLVRRVWSPRLHVIVAFWLLVALLHATVPAGDHLLDLRESHVALIAQGSLAAFSAGLLLTALLVISRGRERRLLFLITPLESSFRNTLAVSARTTRGPPAH